MSFMPLYLSVIDYDNDYVICAVEWTLPLTLCDILIIVIMLYYCIIAALCNTAELILNCQDWLLYDDIIIC